ncbi:hypothetical protein D3C78_679310 [compost metagenome]
MIGIAQQALQGETLAAVHRAGGLNGGRRLRVRPGLRHGRSAGSGQGREAVALHPPAADFVPGELQRQPLGLAVDACLHLQLQFPRRQAEGRQLGQRHIAGGETALQVVADHVGQGVTGVVGGVDLAIAVAQAVGEDLQMPGQGGVERRRQHQVEVAGEPVRGHRLQIQVQGVAAGNAPGLRQFLLRQQPADLDFRVRAGVLGEHIEAQRSLGLAAEADAQLAAGIEILAFAQAEDAIHQLGLQRHETLAVELAVEADIQVGCDLFLATQPAQGEDRLQALRVLGGQHGQAHHQRNEAHGADGHGLARGAPVVQHIGQGDRRQQAAEAPEQAGAECEHHQPDQAADDQQQAAKYQ